MKGFSILSSKSYWLALSVTVLASIVVSIVGGMSALAWMGGSIVLIVGVLCVTCYVDIRHRLSGVAASVAGVRRLEHEARKSGQQAQEVVLGALDSNEKLLGEVGQSLLSMQEDASRREEKFRSFLTYEVASLKDTIDARATDIDKRGRTSSSQLRELAAIIANLEQSLQRLEGEYDRERQGSIGSEVHRTLRLARSLDRSAREAGTAAASRAEARQTELALLRQMGEELKSHRRLLQEIAVNSDF